MTRLVYPRLPHYAADLRTKEISTVYRRQGLAGLESLASTRHPKAAPVATGGRVASEAHIRQVRDRVVAAVKPWSDKAEVPRAEAAAFDRVLGRALHDGLRIIPSDAAHEETWNFLSLVLLPDVVVLRFPSLHIDRLLGKPRNPLRAAWMRWDVLGELMEQGSPPLGVDELVGLFERSSMARNRSLLRVLAGEVLSYAGSTGRSDWARDLFREVLYATGPLLLDGLSEMEMRRWIRGDLLERLPDAID